MKLFVKYHDLDDAYEWSEFPFTEESTLIDIHPAQYDWIEQVKSDALAVHDYLKNEIESSKKK